MSELRNHPRREASCRVVVLPSIPTGAEASGDTFCCSTADVSLGGIRFQSEVGFSEGQVISLEVILGKAYWGFRFKGRVVWVKASAVPARFDVGVQFIDTPVATRLAWEEALSRDLPRRPDVNAAPEGPRHLS